MLTKKKFLFIGNRFNVLSEILNLNLNITDIYVVKDSYLEEDLKKRKIDFKSIENKQYLVENIKNSDFDILVSNGCPYVLPVSEIKKENQFFINIHPSLLPDMKGKHPINGAILFNRKYTGASCHFMDDGIDTGKIIEQVKIKLTPDLDLGLLYKLSFMAEAEAFLNAYHKNFVLNRNIHVCKEPIYYSRTEDDLIINFSQSAENIVRKIKAFGIESIGAKFNYKNCFFMVLDAEIIENDYLTSKINCFKNLEVIFIYENNLIIRKDENILKLKNIKGDLSKINKGEVLL